MNLKLFTFTLLMGSILGAGCSKSFAGTHENHPNHFVDGKHQTGIESLSPKLRAFLRSLQASDLVAFRYR